MPYIPLDKKKFRYAKTKLKSRKSPLKHTAGHILVTSDVDISKIPANVDISTTLVERVNLWEIQLPKKGGFGDYGKKDVKNLAKTLDAVAFLCYDK